MPLLDIKALLKDLDATKASTLDLSGYFLEEEKLKQETEPSVTTFEGHTDGVRSFTYDPNIGFISGSRDNTIKFWDPLTGKCTKTLTGHTDAVYALATLNGQIVSGSRDNTIKLWDPSTGKCTKTLTGHTSGVYDLTTLNGQIVSGAGDYTIKLWDPSTGQCTKTLKGHTDIVKAVTTLNGQIVSASEYHIKVWNPSSGECIKKIGNSEGVHALTTVNGWIVNGGGKYIFFWDPSTDKHKTLKGHTDTVYALMTLDDQIVSGSEDKSIKRWEIYSMRLLCLKDIEPILEALPELKSLNRFSLKGLNLQDKDTKTLIKALESSTVTEVDISHTKLSIKSFNALKNARGDSIRIEHESLMKNKENKEEKEKVEVKVKKQDLLYMQSTFNSAHGSMSLGTSTSVSSTSSSSAASTSSSTNASDASSTISISTALEGPSIELSTKIESSSAFNSKKS